MTAVELLDHCERIEREQGVAWATFVVERKQEPRGQRVRLFPGLFGRRLGTKPPKPGDKRVGVIISVATDDVRRALAKQLQRIERDAIKLAEIGEHDRADETMAQYTALSSRLAQVVVRR